MREPDWDWEEVLAKPAFWGSYYELFLHEDDEGLWGDDDNDDRDDGGALGTSTYLCYGFDHCLEGSDPDSLACPICE